VAPPFRPAQLQLQGPAPLTALGKPTLHSAFFGISPWPFSEAGPQTAFMRGSAEHVAAWPPFKPEQVHAHGPLPVTALAKPLEQRSDIGMLSLPEPLAAPQIPSIFFGALQAAALPPLLPEQAHVHGPEPLTRLAAPLKQRLADGALSATTPLATPHSASSASGELGVAVVAADEELAEAKATDAAQLTVMPPFLP
jgi:hypothetical protein